MRRRKKIQGLKLIHGRYADLKDIPFQCERCGHKRFYLSFRTHMYMDLGTDETGIIFQRVRILCFNCKHKLTPKQAAMIAGHLILDLRRQRTRGSLPPELLAEYNRLNPSPPKLTESEPTGDGDGETEPGPEPIQTLKITIPDEPYEPYELTDEPYELTDEPAEALQTTPND